MKGIGYLVIAGIGLTISIVSVIRLVNKSHDENYVNHIPPDACQDILNANIPIQQTPIKCLIKKKGNSLHK